jgi:hypothetical protein
MNGKRIWYRRNPMIIPILSHKLHHDRDGDGVDTGDDCIQLVGGYI